MVVFLEMMEPFLAGDSPLASGLPGFVEYFPLSHPKEFLRSAAFEGTFATGDLAFVAAYPGCSSWSGQSYSAGPCGSPAVVLDDAHWRGVRYRPPQEARNYVLMALLVALPVLLSHLL